MKLHCYNRLVRASLLLNSLACQVEREQKKVLGDLEIVEVMCTFIQTKLKNKVCDELLKGFSDKGELLRNMMDLMANIAEVQKLWQNLMNEEYVTVFTIFLESKKDGIEVRYNAAGVLSHLLSDGEEAWRVESPNRDEVIWRIVQAIQRWPLESQRNINYRSFGPILNLVRCFRSHASQYWAVWALCNLTKVYPDKYIKLLKEEGGLEILRKVMRDPRPITAIQELAKQVIDRVQMPVEASEEIND
ncbi:protein zer-1 homolog [Dreissena polymorpha]|uniref:protein zer-1 homolog n=1 Tax=Dreissena polymorpha TaxID=45954 RepID=UPI0022645DC3|nr:protein zer-1 homolog [Dreissena polymorpha]